uniref:ARAD1D08360p n=1 Tax=Blastobotrys adeninivorans TaxID=409370 RepID=A0A060TEK1_BLAAD
MNLQPTFVGYVSTTRDALILFQAAISGTKAQVSRRPHDRERVDLIRSGNIFIFNEETSGVKRWTDGVAWSPSRIKGNFLLYRELENPLGATDKKKSVKKGSSTSGGRFKRSSSALARSYPYDRPASQNQGTSPNEYDPHGLTVPYQFGDRGDVKIGPVKTENMIASEQQNQPSSLELDEGVDEEVVKDLVGSLIDSYGFKPDGLIKKTISIQVRGSQHHLVSYYRPKDVIKGKFIRPSEDPELRGLELAREIVDGQHFRVPWREEEQQHNQPYLQSTTMPSVRRRNPQPRSGMSHVLATGNSSHQLFDPTTGFRASIPQPPPLTSRYPSYQLLTGPLNPGDMDVSGSTGYDLGESSTSSVVQGHGGMYDLSSSGMTPHYSHYLSGRPPAGAPPPISNSNSVGSQSYYSGYRPFTMSSANSAGAGGPTTPYSTDTHQTSTMPLDYTTTVGNYGYALSSAGSSPSTTAYLFQPIQPAAHSSAGHSGISEPIFPHSTQSHPRPHSEPQALSQNTSQGDHSQSHYREESQTQAHAQAIVKIESQTQPPSQAETPTGGQTHAQARAQAQSQSQAQSQTPAQDQDHHQEQSQEARPQSQPQPQPIKTSPSHSQESHHQSRQINYSPSLPPLSQPATFYQTYPHEYHSMGTTPTSSDPRKLPDNGRLEERSGVSNVVYSSAGLGGRGYGSEQSYGVSGIYGELIPGPPEITDHHDHHHASHAPNYGYSMF